MRALSVAIRTDHAAALTLLALSCVNEFAWQLAPPGLQGDVSYITAWPMLAFACLLLAVLGQRHSAIVAVAAVVPLQSLPTAASSALWLILRWERLPGQDSASAYLGQWALLLSGLVALLVLWRWPSG